MAQECSLEKMSSGSCGAQEEVLQRRAGERRERKCSRKKKEILYRGAAKRRTVGWKKCVTDDNHVDTRVKKYFNTGEVTVRAPGKAEDVCPPLARRVNVVETMDPQGRNIPIINRDEVNLTTGSMPTRKMKEDWRQEKSLNTSGAFDQIQVFAQMLGGYFRKK